MSQAKVLEVRDLFFGYTAVPVLEGISFSVERGEFITIVGPNGGGKTTLLKLLLGLLRPWSGEILVYGKPRQEQQCCMGYVPQHGIFDRLFPLTVEEMVLQGRVRRWGWYTPEDKQMVKKILEEVELEKYAKFSFSHLSGGQLQRALIARALVSEADILLLDEPSASIDSESEEKLLQLLHSLKGKKTVLLATHDTGFVRTISDRVLCIHRRLCEHPFEFSEKENRGYGYGPDYARIHHEKTIG